MIIFRFIDDKDVFQKFYQKKLAQRLVTSASASDDSESSMITKLKDLSGFDYTNKLTRMFTGAGFYLFVGKSKFSDVRTDMNLSRDLTEKFIDRGRQHRIQSDRESSAWDL